MFKSLHYTGRNTLNKATYELIDNDFCCTLTATNLREPRGVLVFIEYFRRSLNVTKNLFLYYRFVSIKEPQYTMDYLLMSHRHYINKHYPQLEFDKKYYSCVLNQIKKYNFIKGDH